MTQARALERALFVHRFEGVAVEDVLAELARFQNEDGGFGHALEPDMRTPSSSALATGIGLRMLRELGCPAEHPMVRQAVAYLLATYDEQAQVWPVVPPDANEYPHAPWWHDEDGSLARLFDGFRIIPRAILVGSLNHYAALVETGWLDRVTEATVRYIETVEVLGEGGGSDLEYAISLAEAEHLGSHYAARLLARIRAAIPAVVVRDPAQWDTYCITPLKAVPSPDALGADRIPDELQRNLDHLIARQTPEGIWEPTWSWGDAYPKVWPQAKVEWRGQLTLEALMQLEAFGRIAT
jgi:hypothetical protein